MKKVFKVITLSLFVITAVGGGLLYLKHNKPLSSFTMVANAAEIPSEYYQKKYIVVKAGKVIESADTLEETIEIAKNNKRVIAINTVNNEWVYCDLDPYMVMNGDTIHDFKTFTEAINYAISNNYDNVYYKSDKNILWMRNPKLGEGRVLKVPFKQQLPELPRGCEVTSLSMLLEYNNVSVDKLVLAQEVTKDTTPYSKKDGKVYFGNPYYGFVGDMYDLSKPGYGVYSTPIAKLASEFTSRPVLDMTNLQFNDILYVVGQGMPVWIVINSTFAPLPDSYFEYWNTDSGIVKVTYKMHSVLITGYDNKHVYINDPLYDKPNRKVEINNFKAAWEQMGNQAVTIINY